MASTGIPHTGESAAEVTPAAGRRRRLTDLPESSALFVLLGALIIFFSLQSPYFLSYGNGVNILTALAVTGIIAAPMTLLLIGGQFDLSIGSAFSFCGVVMAHVAVTNGVWWGVVAALFAGLFIGLINGFFVTVVGVNPLITTLATLAIFSGAAKLLSGGTTVTLKNFEFLGLTRPIFDIPTSVFIFVVIALLFAGILRYTVYGRSMYAIGSNTAAARLVGIRFKTILYTGFVLTSLCVALGALINVSQLSAAPNTSGLGLELSVITAVILGGASLGGGRGTILGTVIGLLIIGVVNNGLTLLNVDSFWQEVSRGALLLLAVTVDQIRARSFVRFN